MKDELSDAVATGASSGDPDREIRRVAFRLLLTRGRPVPPAQLAEALRRPLLQVEPGVKALADEGRIRLDPSGDLIGACGLSVVPDRHQADIESRRFWTWCAYDILGIIGALEANGRGVTLSPQTGSPIEVAFRSGRPAETEVVLFRPDRYSCSNVYEEWCPNSNLFETDSTAKAWASERGLKGMVLNLVDAAAKAAKECFTWLMIEFLLFIEVLLDAANGANARATRHRISSRPSRNAILSPYGPSKQDRRS